MQVQKRTMLCHGCGKPIVSKDHIPFCSASCERNESKLTKCWLCENACGKCAWSAIGEPVNGWNAKKTRISAIGAAANAEGYIESFRVIDCPEFKLIPCREKIESVNGESMIYVPLGDYHDKLDRRSFVKKYGTVAADAYEDAFSGMIAEKRVKLCITITLPSLGSRFHADLLCRSIVVALRGVAYPMDCDVEYKKYAMHAKEFGVYIVFKEVKDEETE